MTNELRFVEHFAKDKNGNIGIMAALSLPLVIGAVALGVDYGALTVQKRKTQTAVDLAAIQAAADPAHALQIIQKYLRNNGLNYVIRVENGYILPDGTFKSNKDFNALEYRGVVAFQTGLYQADASIPPDQRFTAATTAPDAVRVSAIERQELYFASVFTDPRDFQVVGTASASKYASFWIGSRLASLDGGVLNGILGAMLGTTISLSVADYKALVDADINLLSFSEALATDLQLTGASFDDVLNVDVTMLQVLNAMRKTAGLSTATQTALRGIERAIGSTNTTLRLANFISLGAIGNEAVGSKQSLSAYGNVMQVLSTAAALSNGKRQVDVSLNMDVPGLAGVTLRIGIGQPVSQSPTIASGNTDVVVRTAQIRASIVAQIAGLSSLVGTTVRLPIYLEAAKASASIKSISCRYGTSGGSVDLSVLPGLAEAAIGEIDAQKFNDFTTKLAIRQSTLVSTPLAQIKGIADIDIANLTPRTVHFSNYEVTDRTVKTVSTSSILSSLTTSLIKNLSLEVKVLGLSLVTPSTLQSAIAQTLSSAASPLDAVLYNTLLTLGVRVGEADVGVTGVACGAPVLVQ